MKNGIHFGLRSTINNIALIIPTCKYTHTLSVTVFDGGSSVPYTSLAPGLICSNWPFIGAIPNAKYTHVLAVSVFPWAIQCVDTSHPKVKCKYALSVTVLGWAMGCTSSLAYTNWSFIGAIPKAKCKHAFSVTVFDRHADPAYTSRPGIHSVIGQSLDPMIQTNCLPDSLGQY